MEAITRDTFAAACRWAGRGLRLWTQNLLAPQYCILCQDWTSSPDLRPLCRPCQEALSPLPQRLCDCCGIPVAGNLLEHATLCRDCRSHLPRFDKARAFGLYQGSLRRLIRAYKFKGLRRLAHPLAELLEDAYGKGSFQARHLAWVPSHPRRIRERGFDHMGRLALTFAARSRLPLLGGFVRTRHTPAQSGLSRRQRRRNLQGAFNPPPGAITHPLLLLDDIFTSGTTLEEATAVLLQAGAPAVEVLTVARVPLYWDAHQPGSFSVNLSSRTQERTHP